MQRFVWALSFVVFLFVSSHAQSAVDDWLNGPNATDQSGNGVINAIDYYMGNPSEWMASSYWLDLDEDGSAGFGDYFIWMDKVTSGELDDATEAPDAGEGAAFTEDAGEWSVVFQGSISDVACGTQDGGVVYVLDSSQLHRSSDGGRTWNAASVGSFGNQALVVDPRTDDRLFVATSSGLAVSEDGGQTWSQRDPGFGAVSQLAVTVSDTGMAIFALSRYQEGVMVRSVDGGVTWEEFAQPFDEGGNMELIVDPLNPDKLFLVHSNEGISVSGDNGDTWLQLDNMPTAKVAIRGKRIYAARYGGGDSELVRSDDLGATWKVVETSVPFHVRKEGEGWSSELLVRVHALAVNPTNPDVLYLIGEGPELEDSWLARTADGGQTWETKEFSRWASQGSLSLDPVDPSIVYAGAF